MPDKSAARPTLRFASLAVSSLRPDPAQPRRKRSEASFEELRASMDLHGMLQTILVREENGEFIIVNGERRWMAATDLAWDVVDCLITTATSQQALVLQLIENIQREDLAIEDVALHLKGLLSQIQTEDSKASMRALATTVGKSVGWVSEKLALSNLPDNVKALQESKSVKNSRVLIGLSRLSETNPEAAAALIQQIEDGKGVSVDLINEVRGSQRQRRAAQREKATVDDLPEEIQQSIHEAAGAKANEADGAEADPARQAKTAAPAGKKDRRRAKVVEVAKLIGVPDDLPPDELLEAFAEAYAKLHEEMQLQVA